ncbi:MAG: tRNA (N6-threonylcarbamoyladenosine(37)-N6)-methyltransferase TrmO [Solobacterium sp.]|nr:tRNA (N6-threonylcarbamoyladenosine(37)-N6)-methyltransferase TrmO [Solobacterium sp.]
MQNDTLTIRPIAYVHSELSGKFGIPRQGILADQLEGKIIFTPEYRKDGIIRGLEQFTHLWLLWGFSLSDSWKPMIRPPKLGGSTKVGVFASRSPHRPNQLAMSAVRLAEIREEPGNGTVLIVSGIDLMDGTPIYDIKPYIPCYDSIPEASSGYAVPSADRHSVSVPASIASLFNDRQLSAIQQMLSLNPRPGYQNSPERIYHIVYAGYDLSFRIEPNGTVCICAAVRTAP